MRLRIRTRTARHTARPATHHTARRTARRTSVALGLGAVAAMAAVAAPVTADEVLLASHVLMPDGTLAADMGVLIDDDGVIRRLAPADDLADHPRARHLPDGAVLSPGLIDLASGVGLVGSNVSGTDVIDPAPNVIDGFDVHAPEVAAVLEAGITTVMLAPAVNGLVDGSCATVRTAPRDGRADVHDGACALLMCMGQAALNTELGPTSRSGAIRLLRAEMRSAERQADARLGQAMAGELPVVIATDEPEDVDAMLRLFGRTDATITMILAEDAIDVVETLADYEASAIVGPYRPGMRERIPAAAHALSDAGVRVGFASGMPQTGPDQLRLTAALAVRAGMDPAAARRAITSDAAAIAGLAGKVGSIAPRASADLVVFSGDPLRLDSRVLEVHVRGQRVHHAPARTATTDHRSDHRSDHRVESTR